MIIITGAERPLTDSDEIRRKDDLCEKALPIALDVAER